MPAPDNPTNSNQRVTNETVRLEIAHFAEKLDGLAKEVRQWHTDNELRVRELENWKGVAENEIKVLQVNVIQAQTTADTARQSSAWWNGANSLGIFITAALSVLGIRIK